VLPTQTVLVYTAWVVKFLHPCISDKISESLLMQGCRNFTTVAKLAYCWVWV